MRYEQRCSGCNWLESEGHAKDCVYMAADLGEVMTNLVGPAETIACPDCGFPKDQGYGVPSA